jgi:hypothetical protein
MRTCGRTIGGIEPVEPPEKRRIGSRDPLAAHQKGLDPLGLTIHKRDFMESPIFKAAYQRLVQATGTD